MVAPVSGSQQAGSASLTSSGKDDPPTPGGPVDGVVLGSEMNSSGSKPKGAGKQRDPSKDRPSRSEQIQHAIWNFSRVYPICRAALFVVVGALIGITWGMQSDEEWTFVEVRSFLFLVLRWLGLRFPPASPSSQRSALLKLMSSSTDACRLP